MRTYTAEDFQILETIMIILKLFVKIIKALQLNSTVQQTNNNKEYFTAINVPVYCRTKDLRLQPSTVDHMVHVQGMKEIKNQSHRLSFLTLNASFRSVSF
mgnify:CR=1 FL=1